MSKPADLRIEYWPLDDIARFDRNAKKHDVGALCQSIRRHGFRDAPIFDATLGALVAGHGRLKALVELRKAKRATVPAGVKVDADGRWLVPVQVGVDSPNAAEAQAFLLDHNNIGLLGGDLAVGDILRLYDQDALTDMLRGLGEAGSLPVSLDGDDLDALLRDAEQPQALPIGATTPPGEERQGRGADPRSQDAAPPTGYASAGYPLAVVLAKDELARWREWKVTCGKKTDKAAFLELLAKAEGSDA